MASHPSQTLANPLEVRFDQPLPILDHRDEIARALATHQVVIVAGETGSGKSTQLPKICLTAGFGRRGRIGHTQPRRIAARSIAARLAAELNVPLGGPVGYKIRFQDRSDPRTVIKLMTDGILLAETQSDRRLEQYEVIILDEAHERSLNIDFLLGYIQRTLAVRPELRLVVTSATIDAARFGEHFAGPTGPAPVIEVSGRGYPVEMRYRPLIGPDGKDHDETEGIIAAIQELAQCGRGDMLVFLPTERDIRELHRRLRGDVFGRETASSPEVLPLYARLSAREQDRIFQPSTRRRIVLATNVAESSLTVPNIHYVIDTGTARISRYSPRSKLVRLPIESISQASANQRAGRCGRVAPGICIRLYDEEDFLRRDPYTTPEIRRTNLASVILQAKALQLGEIEEFPFLDPPRPEAVRDGYKTLFELQAIDQNRELTDLGRRLARMPVDPRIGRMILEAGNQGSLHEVLIIAAALELQDPRERPHDKQQQADERHEKFLDRDSDFLSYLKIWEFYHHLRESVSRSKLRKACQENFLSYNRLREWTEIHRQLLEIAQGIRPAEKAAIGTLARIQKAGRGRPDAVAGDAKRQPDDDLPGTHYRDRYAPIHRALLAGLLSGVAYRTAEREYTSAGGLKLQLWPGSGLVRQRHAWIVAAERVETSRRYARIVARISPNWIEPLAGHLVKRSYSDPQWQKRSGRVMAFEKVSLLGMPVVVQRLVPYAPIDPVRSRRIFIQSGLVEQQMDSADRFLEDNRRLIDAIGELAARTRRRDYLIDEFSVYAFYDERLPADICDVLSLQRWLRAASQNRQRLTMRREDFIFVDEQRERQEAFPDALQLGPLELPVTYHFSAGDENDGVTVRVPRQAVNQLSADQLDWLVPGLLDEKVTALIRSLPKPLRRSFVPVPETANRVVTELTFGQGVLVEQLAERLGKIAGERVRPEDFDFSKLPNYLRMNVEVIDEAGEICSQGRDLESLRLALKGREPQHEAESSVTDPSWHRDGLTAWDYDELPLEVSVVRGGISIRIYPALVDQKTDVAMRLIDTAARAEQLTRRGVSRLYALAEQKALRSQIRWLPRWAEIGVWAAGLMTPDDLFDTVAMRLCDLAFFGSEPVPRTRAEYERRRQQASERIAVATQELAALLPRLFAAYQEARVAVESLSPSRHAAALADISEQLRQLTAPDFLIDVPWTWLQQFPRYLTAIAYRIERLLSGGQSRDVEQLQIVVGHWRRYLQQMHKNQQQERYDPSLVEYRWMIEELRVSLFAQPLGTAVKVSPQRLDKQWSAVQTG